MNGLLPLHGHLVRTYVGLLIERDMLCVLGHTLDFRNNYKTSANPPWKLPLNFLAVRM